MTILFGRTGALLVEDGPGAAVGIGFGRAEDLRVSFNVKKHRRLQEPPIAEIQVYNLAEQTRKKLDQARSDTDSSKRKLVQLEAGYGDKHATIFIGDAVEIFSAKTGTEWITRITAVCGREIKRKHINKAFEKGTRSIDVVRALIKDAVAGTRVNASNALALIDLGRIVNPVSTVAKGASESGDPCSILDTLAETHKFEIWIDDNELVVVKPGEVRSGEAVRLWASTGLIGSPERVTDDRRPKTLLCKATSLINPRLAMGNRIDIDSSTMRGSFRIEEIEHRGDTHGEPWHTELEASAL